MPAVRDLLDNSKWSGVVLITGCSPSRTQSIVDGHKAELSMGKSSLCTTVGKMPESIERNCSRKKASEVRTGQDEIDVAVLVVVSGLNGQMLEFI